ncbi:hypothetical protein WD019_19475 [Fictibacillus sp. Mic-4]|uniref:hypothetical protein n=1 Tax=Fictibacillus sp. Mic-4 TaxID=3132826 RepID=UPI003CF09083
MVGRKLNTALVVASINAILYAVISVIIAIIGKLRFNEPDALYLAGVGASLFVFLYSLPGVVLYGLPVSVLSEYVTKHVKRRKIYSFIIHLLFGVTFVFFFQTITEQRIAIRELQTILNKYGLIMIFSTLSSVLFWFIEEVKRRNRKQFQ